jgi:putative flippase GtrA
MSGGLGAVTQLGGLFILKEFFHLWYLLASLLSYIFAVFVGFTLQKFWTFKGTQGHTHKQAMGYVGLFVINLGINTLMMYVFVDKLNIWYLGAQVIASGLIAIESFFVYRHIIFKHHE